MSLTLGIIASSRGNIVPPLDTYGGAAAAYSTRLLSSAYGGSAVRVRRSFDNTEQDIGFSGGAIDETALMNFVGYQNLFQRSEEFENGYWAKDGSTITANSTNSPIGTLTADTISETATTGVHIVGVTTPLTLSAQSYTISCYMKAGTSIWGGLSMYNGVNNVAIYNLQTGQVGSVANGSTATITSIGDGWYRCTLTTVMVASANNYPAVIMAQSATVFNYTGNTANNIYIWGAQLNIGTTAQPYQVTTSAARSGDGFVTKWYTQDSNGENLLLQSQTFTDSNWIKNTSTVTSNAGTDPFGGNNATRWLSNVGSATHYLGQTRSLTVGQTYIVSFWVKSNTGSNQLFRLFGSSLLVGPNLTATTEWQRFSFVFTAIIDAVHGITRPLDNAAVDLLVYGAQLSQSSWLQGYQATTTAQVFRRDASQSTAANQPRIVGGGVIERENGKASIFFDGVNDFLTGTDIALPVWSIFSTAVNTIPSTIGANTIYSRGSSSNNSRDAVLYLNNSSSVFSVQAQRANGVSFPTSTAYNSIKNYLLSSGIFSGSSITAFADSIAGTSVSTTIAGSVNPVTLIGATRDTGSTTLYMGGEIGEIVVYDSDRTATRADIERNLGSYYQTQWTGASSGLLDQFGGAAAAYSLRNLSSSYRGPLIRVRRSSDNAETDIGGTYNGDLDVASLVSFTGGQNLILSSDNFAGSDWVKTNSTVSSNVTIAPDGTLTADKFTETAVNGIHNIISNSTSVATSQIYTTSVYVKSAERSIFFVGMYYDAAPTYDAFGAFFNTSTGLVESTLIGGSGVLISTSIQSVGNGWYRLSVTGNTNKTGIHRQTLYICQSVTINPYLGVAGSGIYIWGAQINTGILQPYIPTTTAAVNGANAFVTKWYTQDNNYQNLLLQSNSFTVSPWTSVIGGTGVAPVLTANAGTDPFGGNTATRLVMNAGAGSTGSDFSSFLQTATGVGTSTCSIWVKSFSGTTQYLNLNIAGGVGIEVIATNVWQRVSFTSSSGNRIQLVSSGVNTSKTADILIYGAQLNEGTLTPYTATTTTVSQRRDAIQATAASQPRIVNAGGVESEGNKPALFFNGTSMFMTSPTLSFGPTDYSAMSVSKSTQADTTGDGVISIATATGGNNGWYALNYRSNITNSFRAFFTSDGSVLNFTSISPTSLYLETMNLNDSYVPQTGTISHSINGVQQGTVPAIGQTINNAQFWIGSYYNTGGTYTHSGTISEVEFYTSNQFSARPTIQSNINSYYRIYWQGNGTALLDSFSGASAAYSLRNLSSAYTGPLIRVRRSNDNIERDIYGTFGGDLDIASLVAFVGANNGFVTTWYDQSGSARHATQGTAANQPRIVNAGVVETENGKPTVFFDGVNDVFSTNLIPNPSSNTPYSIHVVISALTQTSFRGVLSIGNATTGVSMFSVMNGGNWGTFGSNAYYASQNIQSAGIKLIEMYGAYSVATHNFYTNGSSGGTYPNSGGQGSKHIGGQGGQEFNGDISEIIYYNADRTSSRIPIESNINNYYKIY